MNKIYRFWSLVLGVSALASSAVLAAAESEDDGARGWEEMEISLPSLPKDSDLVSFYVSPSTDNRFFIDPASISVGSDGVVRYTLVVLSSAGSRNVSYEGMRCETQERRLYAFGHADGTWSKSRKNQWEPIREAVSNRHHAALYQEYFCPGGIIVRNPAEAREVLRRGGTSALTTRW